MQELKYIFVMLIIVFKMLFILYQINNSYANNKKNILVT